MLPKVKSFIVMLIVSAIVFASCTKNEYEYVTIENVTVNLEMKSVIRVNESQMRSAGSEYQHAYPTSYNAYFVANETKGMYTKGQLVKTLEVGSGSNTIVVPKLSYTVYVTNYEKAGSWYTWADAVEQLPLGSYDLYFYGKNDIDYSKEIYGEVEVLNPYSAIMINPQYLDPARTPKEYNSGLNYKKLDDGWWLVYVRKSHNSQVWVPNSHLNGASGNTAFGFSADVEPNKIYQYYVDLSVGNTDGEGNLGVVVDEFSDTVVESINPFK